jgi:membrane-bound ClpP family serine protease
MRISAGLFLIALGAILTFAVQVHTQGFNIHTIGVILMIVGAAGLILSLTVWNQRQRTVIRRGPGGQIVEEHHTTVEYDDPSRL